MKNHKALFLIPGLAVGSTIAAWHSPVLAQINVGANNGITGTLSSIAGGDFNTNKQNYSTIAGGYANDILNFYSYSFIGAGLDNSVLGPQGVIGGGQGNIISTNSQCVIGGGLMNTAIGFASFIGGGFENETSLEYDLVAGGRSNFAGGTNATVAGGYLNTASGKYTTVAGGYSNDALAYSAFVGAGYNNTANNSYAAVAGGLLNIASGYGSFVGGGEDNAATNFYAAIAGGTGNDALGYASFIGGGIGNRGAANYNTVSGGYANIADGNYGTISGGSGNVATNEVGGFAEYATIAGGRINRARGYASVGGGEENNAKGAWSTVPGGKSALADKIGQVAHASGSFSSQGDAQVSTYVLRRTTTNSTLTELFLDGAGGAGSRMAVRQGGSWTFDILVIARNTLGHTGGYSVRGVIENVGGTTALVGSAPTVVVGTEDIASWDVTVSADNTNDALLIKVTGDSSSIRWVASVRTVEVSQ